MLKIIIYAPLFSKRNEQMAPCLHRAHNLKTQDTPCQTYSERGTFLFIVGTPINQLTLLRYNHKLSQLKLKTYLYAYRTYVLKNSSPVRKASYMQSNFMHI